MEEILQKRMTVWQITKRLATTAQKTPAGWLGTVLPLETSTQQKKDSKKAFTYSM
jgi:hypothetical protein